MDGELRVCLTALAYVIRKEFSSGMWPRLNRKLWRNAMLCRFIPRRRVP